MYRVEVNRKRPNRKPENLKFDYHKFVHFAYVFIIKNQSKV